MPENLINRNGIWYVRKLVNGRRVWLTTGESNLERARRVRDSVLVKVRDTDRGWLPDHTTVQEWWATYQRVWTPTKRAPHRDAQLVRYFLDRYGSLRLRDIRQSHCQAYLNERARMRNQHKRPIAAGTIERERGFLRGFFQRAVEDRKLETNPWQGIKRLKTTVRQRVLSVDEQTTLMAIMSPQMQRWLVFMLGTGLRAAEAQAITPACVHDGLLDVPASAAKFGKARTIPVHPQVQAVIDAQLAAVGKLWNSRGNYYRKQLDFYCAKAGITGVSPHTLRHTFGTRYIEGGGDLLRLTDIMGHASVEVTRRNYVHESQASKTSAFHLVSMHLPTVEGTA